VLGQGDETNIARENAMRRHVNTTAEVVSFSAGAIVGAGLALLYAPKTGHEVRAKVGDVTEDAIAKMKQATANTQEKLNRNLRKGRDYAEEKVSELKTAPAEETFH
jgi:gas vesicle protein